MHPEPKTYTHGHMERSPIISVGNGTVITTYSDIGLISIYRHLFMFLTLIWSTQPDQSLVYRTLVQFYIKLYVRLESIMGAPTGMHALVLGLDNRSPAGAPGSGPAGTCVSQAMTWTCL